MRVQHTLYWRDRENLDGLAPNVPFDRDLVNSEFDELSDQDLADVTRVRVWRGGEGRGSGSVRHRRPLGDGFASYSDAEDAVNGFFHLGPPQADQLK